MNVYKVGTILEGGSSRWAWGWPENWPDAVQLGQNYVAGTYFQGRVAVHEIGHYLGLYHDFREDSCNPDCYNDGDFLCDTQPSTSGLPSGFPCWWKIDIFCDSTHTYRLEEPFNYMAYARDSCLEYFTAEQAGRMRCILPSYRPVLYDSIVPTFTANVNASQASTRLGCPAGDWRHYIITVDFADAGMRHDIAASELTVEKVVTSTYAFWDTVIADSAATSSNGYRTTITQRLYSGCTNDSMVVKLDGVPIGKAYLRSRSADFLPTSPGIVDASDLTVFAAAFPSCPDSANYNPCANLAIGSDIDSVCVDSSDLSAFAAHFGQTHKALGYPNMKTLFAGSEVSLVEESRREGRITVGVTLRTSTRFSVLGLVVGTNRDALWYRAWHPDPGLAADTYAFYYDEGEDGPRVTIVLLDGNALDASEVRLGALEFDLAGPADVSTDLRILFGQTASEGGDVVLGVQRAGKQGEPAGTVPWETRLESAAPNPFNPGTVLRYMVSGEVHVDLAIYDIQGRLVRRLVNAKQRQGAYRVAWDGQEGSFWPTGRERHLPRAARCRTAQAEPQARAHPIRDDGGAVIWTCG